MKKILYSVMALAIAAMTFTACEDVPEPYPTPTAGGGGNTEVTYEGQGTLDSPYTVADAINYAKSLGQAESENQVYIKGFITAITEEYTTNFGNGTFVISDTKEGANKFTVYRALYLGNKKFTSKDTQINVGDEVIVYGKVVNYRGNTPETVQNTAFLYSLNGVSAGGGGSDTPAEAKGTGTLADPFNAAAALAYAKEVGDKESDKEVYIKGKVSTITEQYGAQYGNATFNISEDGTTSNEFTIYRALYLGNKKYTSGDLLNEGDEVIVCGKVTCFKGNTPETVQGKAYLYSLNGKTEAGGETPNPQSGDEPKGTGTESDPYNVAAAIAKCKEVGETATTEKYYVKGIVVKGGTVSGGYGNVTFDMGDSKESTELFKAFQVAGIGGEKLSDGYKVNAGDEVVICGPLANYKGNTPETTGKSSAYIVSIKQSEGGGDNSGGSEEGTVLTSLVNGDFEAWADGLPTGWKSASTASSANLTQSTDAHGGSYSVNVNGKEGSNVRLASQEIKLAAGTYVFSFYAKATTSDVAQVRPGYVPVADGKVGSYAYGDYANIDNTGWTLVSHEFTLDAETIVCLVVMNPKKSNYSSGKDILVDDATLTKK